MFTDEFIDESHHFLRQLRPTRTNNRFIFFAGGSDNSSSGQDATGASILLASIAIIMLLEDSFVHEVIWAVGLLAVVEAMYLVQ